MKVFVVSESDYDYRIAAVALDRELAEQFVRDDFDPTTGHSKRGRYADDYQIEEWEALV